MNLTMMEVVITLSVMTIIKFDYLNFGSKSKHTPIQMPLYLNFLKLAAIFQSLTFFDVVVQSTWAVSVLFSLSILIKFLIHLYKIGHLCFWKLVGVTNRIDWYLEVINNKA